MKIINKVLIFFVISIFYVTLKYFDYGQYPSYRRFLPFDASDSRYSRSIFYENIPIQYYNSTFSYRMVSSEEERRSCHKFPSLQDLKFNNLYWQVHDSGTVTFYLYGAYLDLRQYKTNGSFVRILGMVDGQRNHDESFCIFWYENTLGITGAKTKLTEYEPLVRVNKTLKVCLNASEDTIQF